MPCFCPLLLNGYEFVCKQITPASLPSWKTTSAVEVGARVESETSYIRQDENQTVIEREDVIEGFSFGTTLVPFSGIFGVMLHKVCLKRKFKTCF
jgi:hypothetical protein